MNSRQIRHFEVMSSDSADTVQKLKDEVAAETKQRLESLGATDIHFTFRQMNQPPPGFVAKIEWEMQADFTPRRQ